MVKVITIRDDVYEELSALKRSKNMSFSQVIEYLLRVEREGTLKRAELSALKGSLVGSEVKYYLLKRLRRPLR